MTPVSAIIITFNEELNIGRCLQSLKGLADEIVIVDSFSKDKTEEICKSFGAKFIQHSFEGYIEQKNFALDHASNDFVLSLDADEALSEELRKSVLKVKDNLVDAGIEGYQMNRLTNYCGKWIKHGGWYPDVKLRMFNRKKGKWDGDNPHDKFVLKNDSKTKFLEGDILHYTFYTIDEHRKQARRFAEISAASLYAKGKKSTILQVTLGPVVKFIRAYMFELGFLDGYFGLMIAIISAQSTYLKHTHLRRLYKASFVGK